MKKNLTCASFFAGVGGIDYGFQEEGYESIYANEIDEYAIKTYEENFNIKVDNRDIRTVEADEIPDFDIMLGGFPCQAFSVAGHREGFNDERGTLFFQLERIFIEKKPKVIFLENVKNLTGHDRGQTFRTILMKLESAGYAVKYQVLNSMEYGDVPQNRERIYIVAFRDKELYKNFEFPKPIALDRNLEDVISYTDRVDDKFYYTPDKCKFFKALKEGMMNPKTTYQWRRVYVRENKSNVCPTLTANMGTGGHNVPLILAKHGIRKLTPRECFNLQGFPEHFTLPKLANTRLYKQAGNSVTVTVIARIAKEIKRAINQ